MNIFSHGKIIASLQYFTTTFEDYWHILYPVISKEKLRIDPFLYFYDISKKATDYHGEFSNEGIYQFFGYDGKYHIHSLEIAQFALACWVAWRNTKNNKWLKNAMHHSNWLLFHQKDDGSWRMEHRNPIYSSLDLPWPSSLAQGLAISSLYRAYLYSKKKQYLNSVISAIDFLEKDVRCSGLKRFFSMHDIYGFIYEEYPNYVNNGVLNGYISAILAIYEFSKIDPSYNKLLEINIENLLKIIKLYDSGFYSYYSLDKNISSGFYHRYVVNQLIALEKIDNRFSTPKQVFQKYRDSKICAFKAFARKLYYESKKNIYNNYRNR